MVKRFYGRAIKTGKGNWQSKRCQALCRIQHTMRQLPVQIDDLTVDVKKRQGTPRGAPIERAKGGRKLIDAMRLDHVL